MSAVCIFCCMTLSVTLICKNEEDNLRRLLPTLTFSDEIVVVDTGSADNTVAVARQYTENVYYFKWRDDFAAARNYAISKAHGGYVMWLDADDELPDKTVAEINNLKTSASLADTYFLRYRMGRDSDFWFWRERILRRTKECRFRGFIHEAITPFGSVKYLDCDVVHTSTADHSERNLAIYRSALTQGRRFSPRDKYYYARTLVENGLTEEAIPVLVDFCRNPKAYVVDRVQGYKILARTSLKTDNGAHTLKYLSKSVALLPPDSEISCLFGDYYVGARRFDLAAAWYEYALNSTYSYGFVNGYYKAFYPSIQLSVCYFYTGNYRRAKRFHERAKSLQPSNPAVVNNERWFK